MSFTRIMSSHMENKIFRINISVFHLNVEQILLENFLSGWQNLHFKCLSAHIAQTFTLFPWLLSLLELYRERCVCVGGVLLHLLFYGERIWFCFILIVCVFSCSSVYGYTCGYTCMYAQMCAYECQKIILAFCFSLCMWVLILTQHHFINWVVSLGLRLILIPGNL